MASKVEHIALVTQFPKLSATHRESVIQALAEILVADYKANQQVSSPTVKTGRGINRDLEGSPNGPINRDGSKGVH